MNPPPKSLFQKLRSKNQSTSQPEKVGGGADWKEQQRREFKQWQKNM